MATDLFGKYYNNPTKSYIFSNILCNGASGDEMSFDIVGGDGVISSNDETLSKIDLSDVHVGLTQYTSDMKIIDPYSFIYIKGIAFGEAYTTKAFGRIGKRVLEYEDWMYISTMIIHIKYINQYGNKVLQCLRAAGSFEDDKTFIEACQELFDKEKIPINITYEDGYIYLTATQLGFDFWIPVIELWTYTGSGNPADEFPHIFVDPSTDGTSNNIGFGYDDEWAEATGAAGHGELGTGNAYTGIVTESTYRDIYDNLGKTFISQDREDFFQEFYDVSTNVLFNTYLFEDLTKYIPAHKYRNGAMKGCVVVAKYPEFNAETITEPMRSLKIAHLVDRVEEYYTTIQNEYSGLPLYVRVLRDVVDSYFSQYEYDIYNKWSNAYTHINYHDNWIDPEEIPFVRNLHSDWDHSHVPNYYMLNSLYKDVQHYDAIGLYGYANYLSKHNLWMVMGQFYARTAVSDDPSSKTRNLIPSFIIYNPNGFPVQVKYMTFV